MTAQELKNSILQLAIQGKLVPQNNSDEPASELLKRITSEKDRLLREGKIKREKPLPRITEEEIPFEIPSSWAWVRLHFICQLLDGEKCSNKVFPYLEAKVLRGKSEAVNHLEGKYVPINTRLILVDGENSGEVFFANEEGYMGSTFKVLFIPDTIFEKYVLFFLELKRGIFRNSKTGEAIPHLNKELFFRMPFPVPPFEEQKRIVAKIEELMPLVEEYGNAEKELSALNAEFPEQLRKSILQLAVQGKLVSQNKADESVSELLKRIRIEKRELDLKSNQRRENILPIPNKDEVDIPSNWSLIRVGEVGVFKKGPFGSSITKSIFVPKGDGAIKVYEQKNAIQKNACIGEYYITREYFEKKMKSFEVLPGDVIVSCAGTIGETYIMPSNIEPGIINQALMRMRIVQSVNLKYFLLYFDYVLKLQAQQSGRGSAIKNIPPFDIFKNMIFPVPPIEEQARIVARVEELLSICKEM